MNEEDNPYSPGAGARPPELAGRDAIIHRAEVTIKRAKAAKAPKSFILLGLRGVGKTVLLNEFEQIAERNDCQAVLFEADDQGDLAQQLTPQLHQLLLKLSRIAMAGHGLKRAFGLLQGFASVFKVKHGDIEFGIAEPVTGNIVLDLTEILVSIGEAAAARKTAAVLLVDEIHTLNQQDMSALIMALHKISQKQLPVLLFGGGLPQLAKLAGQSKTYAERLFNYPRVERLDAQSARAAIIEPARALSVKYDKNAVSHIIKVTEGYPFFLQLWGSHAWQAAPSSPIKLEHAKLATKHAIKELDEGIFNSRFERLTERQAEYARALAEAGGDGAKSADVASILGMTVHEAAGVRDELIKKGMAYSAKRGLIAFTAPLFDDYMKRKMPDFRAKTSPKPATKKPATKKPAAKKRASKKPASKKPRKARKKKVNNGRQGSLF